MPAVRYNLTVTKNRQFSRKLMLTPDQGDVPDLTYTIRFWERHIPDVPIAVEGANVSVPESPGTDVALEIPPAGTDALDAAKVYAYQIDGLKDDVPEVVAHGRIFVGAEWAD